MRGRHGGLLRGGVYGKPSTGFTRLAAEVDPVNFTVGILAISGPVLETALGHKNGKIWIWKLYYTNVWDMTGKKYATPEEAMGAVL